MASISKTVRPKRSNNASVNPVGMGLTVGRGTPVASATAGATILFQEPFDNGSIGTRGWFDSSSVPVAAEARPGSSGTTAMAWTWNSGATQPTGVTVARKDFTASESVYFSYWIKCSTNWVGSGVNFHPHMFHFLTDVDDHYIGPSVTHLTTYDELLYTSGGMDYMMTLQDSLNIDTNNLLVDLTGITENRSVCGANGRPESGFEWDTYDNGGGDWRTYKILRSPAQVITDATKNSWHHIESYWQMNTISGGIGQPDGVMQLWVDGVQIQNRSDVYFRTGANPTMKFRTFVMAPYIQVGSPVTQSMWIDDIVVATGRTEGTPTPPSAVVTGTAADGWYEAEIVNGGDTLILTVADDTWVTSGTLFNAQRQNIIDGIVASTSPGSGWNAVRSSIPVTAVVRTSNTVVTITLPALAGYSVTTNQVLTVTIPGSALLGGGAVVATPTITVTEGAPPAGGGLNEPAGYTLFTQNPWNSLTADGWYVDGGSPSLTTDATAPESPSGILRASYPVGYAGGVAPWHMQHAPISTSEIYYRLVFKHSSNWQGHPTGRNKIGIVWHGGQPKAVFEVVGSGTGNLVATMVMQGTPGGVGGELDLAPNLGPSGICARDTWHTMELQMIIANNGSNCTVRMWLNGTKIMDHTGVNMGSGSVWDYVDIHPIWGGGGGVVSSAMTLDFDHIYVSGKA